MTAIGQGSGESLASDRGILCLGFMRTGTFSMAHALVILGYNEVLHGLYQPTEEAFRPWARAAWACFPFIREELYPTNQYPPWLEMPPPKDWTRSDWDLVCGKYEVVTDIASLFAKELIKAYPRAKVDQLTAPACAWRGPH